LRNLKLSRIWQAFQSPIDELRSTARPNPNCILNAAIGTDLKVRELFLSRAVVGKNACRLFRCLPKKDESN